MRRLHRLVLRLYPREFRERYGPGFLETWELRRTEARRSRGPVGMAWFHVREMAGAVLGAVRHRRDWAAARRRGEEGGGAGSSEPYRRSGPGLRAVSAAPRALRHATRRLLRSPGFASASVATLALAMGAVTAIFGVVEGVVLDPLPYPESDRIVWLDHRAPGIGADGGGLFMTRGLFHFYRERSRTLEEVAIYRTLELTLTGDDGDALPVETLQATWTLFPVLGVGAARGRVFGQDDRYGDEGGVVVLTDGFWRRRYGADPDVVGRTVRLAGTAHRIVGVLPPGGVFPTETEVVIPREVPPPSEGFGGWVERGVGRMAPGVAAADVERDLRELVPRIPDAFADPFARQSVEDAEIDPLVSTLKEHMVGDVEATLWILMGSVGLLLLIACANVANLLLVRSEARRREVALRKALGAGRGALAGLFLSESLVLAVMGGALGVGLAVAGLDAMLALAPPELPRVAEVGVDGSVLAVTALLTGGVAVAFGLLPLAWGGSVAGTLRAGGRGVAGGASRTRSLLVVVQVSLALVLLVGSGLTIRTFRNLRNLDPGFRAENALTFFVGIPARSYGTEAEQAAFHEALLERLGGLAGVSDAGAVGCLPLSGCGFGDPLYEADRVYATGEIPPIVRYAPATPGYFRALGIRLMEGRVFEGGGGESGVNEVVVSRSLAERFWPGESALGRRVNNDGTGEDEPWYTVVGVVDAVRSEGLARAPTDQVYYPLVDRSDDTRPLGLYYVLRTSLPPESLVSAVREELRRLDPAVPLSRVASVEEVVGRASASPRFTMTLLVLAGVTALVLGLVGIYGVVSYVVSLRRAEIGVRMALGAEARQVRRMVLGRGAALAAAGIALGLVGAVGLSRVLESVLFQVSGTDPATYAAAAGLLLAVSLGAAWIPAHRATQVDPTEVLRAE